MDKKWLSCLSLTGRYQIAVEQLGDNCVSNTFGSSWEAKTNIGTASSE